MPRSRNPLPSRLLRRARYWAGRLTKLAKANAPEHLKKFIFSKVEPNSESPVYTLRVFVDINRDKREKYGSADVAAQEFGSGLHSTRGPKRKYPIVPRNKKALAFYWDKAEDFIPRLPDGRVILPGVMHPGIEPRPYIKPAVTELRATLREELDVDIRESIKVSMAEAFKGAKRR